MDAKRKAAFINSIASYDTVPCPKCGKDNKSSRKLCFSCGADLSLPPESATNDSEVEQTKKSVDASRPVKYIEPSNAFAQGLPEWSIEPPEVLVRRV